MRTAIAFTLVAAAAIILGCVLETRHTIDAYIRVDIRHIQEQADAVLDFVEGRTDTLERPAAGNANTSWLNQAVQFLSPFQTAYARESLRETSPEVERLARQMRERYSDLQALKRQEVIGENNKGYVEFRDRGALETVEARQEAEELVNEENDDRRALYQEIARLNAEQNVSVGEVERIFAQRRLERASSGEIFQLPPPGRDFDRFANSAAGRRLRDDCQPNAWVEIP